ncbi:MAG: hypothetical protein BWY76_02966 [bacterium ADurb.Bin429]|nr:MAG: hypothetical protein BWY76_02966 [bacterium ADurb.Bin429]
MPFAFAIALKALIMLAFSQRALWPLIHSSRSGVMSPQSSGGQKNFSHQLAYIVRQRSMSRSKLSSLEYPDIPMMPMPPAQMPTLKTLSETLKTSECLSNSVPSSWRSQTTTLHPYCTVPQSNGRENLCSAFAGSVTVSFGVERTRPIS